MTCLRPYAGAWDAAEGGRASNGGCCVVADRVSFTALGKVATRDEHGKPLPRADLTSEMEGVAYQLLARAQLGRLSGRFDTARFELRAMSAVVDWLGDAALSAECLLEQAAVEYNTAQPSDALPYLDRMLSISRELEDARLTCRGLIEAGSTLRMLQRRARAAPLMKPSFCPGRPMMFA